MPPTTSPRRAYLGWSLLALAAVLAAVQLFWGVFADEGDNLAVGRLLCQGEILYRDLFSHHFPLPYHWVAAVTCLAGPSVLAVRASLLLVHVLLLGYVMVATRLYVATGLLALAWSALGHLYLGNLFIYHSIKASALLAVFVLTLAALTGIMRPRLRHALVAGLAAAIAFWSDPMAVYPLAVAFAILVVARVRLAYVVGMAAPGVLLGLLYLARFLWVGSLTPFVDSAWTFNIQVYGQYLNADPSRFATIAAQAVSGLGVLDARWRDANPLKPFAEIVAGPDRWLFTGLLFRLAVLATVVWLALRRRYAAAIYVYLLAAASLGTRRFEGFQAGAFALTALWCAGWLAAGGEGLAAQAAAAGRRVRRYAGWLAQAVALALLLWPVGRSVGYIVERRADLTYAANFAAIEERADLIRTLSCAAPGVTLAYYPGNPLLHMVTGLRPLAGYAFMWPWVAEVALPQVMAALDADAPTLIHVERQAVIWERPVADYLAPLLAYLDAHYTAVGNDFYQSPALAAACPVAPE